MGSKNIPLNIKNLLNLGLLFFTVNLFSNIDVHTSHDSSLNETLNTDSNVKVLNETHANEAEEHNSSASHGHGEVHFEGPIDSQEEIDAYKNEHLKDSHSFGLWRDGETGHHIGFSLPVMFFDEGFHMFSSSKFDYGHEIAESNGKFYKLFNAKIYRVGTDGELSYDSEGHITNPRAFDISITKNVIGMILAGGLMLILFSSLARSYKKAAIPTGFRRLLEPLVIYVRDEIAIPNIGENKYRKYMGYLLTVFFFIWILNLLGMTPFGFGVTNNIAVTSCLALFTYLIIQFSANKDYWKHIFWMPGVPVPMKIAFIPIEILGTLTKPFSLMIRLFANMTAGHVVVMTLISLAMTFKAQFGAVGSTGMSFFFTLFISVIELLVAFLQAFIFTMLSSLFIGLATADHEHDHEHEAKHSH